jgi:hypothetical protein
MIFRTIPPDPSEFPRIRMILPLVMSSLILGFGLIVSSTGHQWNIHGDGALLLGLFLISAFVGSISSCFMLSSLVPALIKHKSLRTPLNLACTATTVVYVAICFVYFLLGLAETVFPGT